MAKETDTTVKGASGASYAFGVYPWGTSFKAIGAVYLILKKNPSGNFTIIYIGQTGDLSSRFGSHHKQACFDRNGKTHIGVKTESTEQRRLNIETDLINNYSTICNG